MLKTVFDGEEIIHRMLWEVVKEQVEVAQARQEGWFSPSMVARVFAYHTVEAHLNYVGERIAPEIWQDEWNYFRKEPYRGALGVCTSSKIRYEPCTRHRADYGHLPGTPSATPDPALCVLAGAGPCMRRRASRSRGARRAAARRLAPEFSNASNAA
jgi:hypothetical protein